MPADIFSNHVNLTTQFKIYNGTKCTINLAVEVGKASVPIPEAKQW